MLHKNKAWLKPQIVLPVDQLLSLDGRFELDGFGVVGAGVGHRVAAAGQCGRGEVEPMVCCLGTPQPHSHPAGRRLGWGWGGRSSRRCRGLVNKSIEISAIFK